MNYVIIILIPILIVAASLTIIPVQKVQTVHGTILLNTAEVQRFTANDQADINNVYDGEVEIEATAPFTLLNLYICDVEIGTTNDVVNGDTLKLIDIEVDDVPLSGLSSTGFPDITLDDQLFSGAICIDLADASGFTQISANGELDFILDERDDDAEDDADGMDIVAIILLPSNANAAVRFAAAD